jgi:hypothetical protein
MHLYAWFPKPELASSRETVLDLATNHGSVIFRVKGDVEKNQRKYGWT